jgi:hypothetical protein|nr:MAG TPA: hypothetical protein [Caudoviricetes sp.]
MTFTDEEIEKDLKLLEKIFDELNIPNKPSPDGVARINGMTVEEYFKNHDLWDRDNYKDYDLEKVYEQSMRK